MSDYRDLPATVRPAGVEFWYVRAALEARFAGMGSVERPVHSVQEGLKVVVGLRGDLQWFITRQGAMVALATLAKGALRQAFLATGGNPAEFPSEFVLLEGAYFTGLMALVYIPTYTILAAVGADLVESAYPVTAPDLDWENLSPVAGEPQEPGGDPATAIRGGRQPASQRLDPGAGRRLRGPSDEPGRDHSGRTDGSRRCGYSTPTSPCPDLSHVRRKRRIDFTGKF
jgi:hypothetical protein